MRGILRRSGSAEVLPESGSRAKMGSGFRGVRRRAVATVFLVVLVASLYFVPTGYLAVYPGPVRPMAEMVSVDGASESTGCLYMVLVVVKEANFFEAVYAAVRPEVALWSKRAVLGGRTFEEYSWLAREDMARSQELAVKLALEMTARGRSGEEFEVPEVKLEAGDVGGPSAGLMFFLEVASRLGPEELRLPGKVAGTGILRPDGSVLPVGGIEQKTIAARNAGIRYFIVPERNESSARRHAGEMKIVPVRDCREALSALRDIAEGRELSGNR